MFETRFKCNPNHEIATLEINISEEYISPNLGIGNSFHKCITFHAVVHGVIQAKAVMFH